MEDNRLFKAKINTQRNISIYNHSGEFSHTSYQMKNQQGNRTFGQHNKWPNGHI